MPTSDVLATFNGNPSDATNALRPLGHVHGAAMYPTRVLLTIPTSDEKTAAGVAGVADFRVLRRWS